ncbi:calcium-binding protein [Streptomyces sp. NPDC012510]|uniref:calcium-binding protein n=1 Tax=Streptomyces sp. NPDC012510 TaxID=3364838 RepID=UPI0036EE5F4C
MGLTTRKGLKAAVTATAMGAAVLLSAGQAHAATGVTANSAFINVNAAAGKANRITVTASGTNVVITDTGDTVTAGAGCTQRTANSVTCPAGTRTLIIQTGDLNDSVLLQASLRASIYGQTGNDQLHALGTGQRAVLSGAEGDDSLYGGSADDDIVGGTGNDTMVGGAGNDRITAQDGLGGNDYSDGDLGRDVCVSDVGDREFSCDD